MSAHLPLPDTRKRDRYMIGETTMFMVLNIIGLPFGLLMIGFAFKDDYLFGGLVGMAWSIISIRSIKNEYTELQFRKQRLREQGELID
jgi:hypothetical protein